MNDYLQRWETAKYFPESMLDDLIQKDKDYISVIAKIYKVSELSVLHAIVNYGIQTVIAESGYGYELGNLAKEFKQ